jgi:hypothetical protein
MPALTRSRIMAGLELGKDAHHLKLAFPAGVVASRAF